MKRILLVLLTTAGFAVVAALVMMLYAYTGQSESSVLMKQRFINSNQEIVFNGEDLQDANMDLKTNNYFGGENVAFKNGYLYEGYNADREKGSTDNKENLHFDLLAKGLTTHQIRLHNYVVVRKAKKGHYFVFDNGGFKKVKICYRKDCLPKKLYVSGVHHQPWTLLETYTYPYHTERGFNKGLNVFVKEVMNGNRE